MNPDNGRDRSLLPDDAVLGSILLQGSIPEPIRLAFRADLFLPARQALARSLLAVSQRLGGCPLEAVKEEMATQGAGVREIMAMAGILGAGALPDELPDLWDALEQRTRRKLAAEMRVVSLEELMATKFPKRRAHVGRGILPAQGKALITGHGGVGKTVLLLQTALELAAGRPWLGHWLGDGPSRVGLLLQEDPPEITQERFRGLLRALALEARTDLAIFLNEPTRYLNVTQDADFAWMLAFVKYRSLDLLIPDPLITFHRESENDNAKMRFVLDRFTAIQAETGCALLLAHHHRKSPEGIEDFDAARGARAIQDWARTVVNLTGQKKVEGRDRIRMSFSKLNYGPMPPGPTTLERDPETLLIRVVEEEELCSAERAAQILEEIGGETPKKGDWYGAVQKATSASDKTVRNACAKAVRLGYVLEGAKGGQGGRQAVRVVARGNERLPET